MWNLWFFGHEREKIRPYKYLIKNIQDLDRKIDRTNIHRTNKVMSALIDIAIQKELITESDDISKLSTERADEIFNITYGELMSICYENKHFRSHDIHCNTIANQIYTKYSKKRKRTDSSQENNEY
jgi:hypothetical protein